MTVELPTSVEGLLLDSLKWAEEIGQRYNIPFIIDSGTLLGLMRDGRLLPGDTDLDLSLTSDAQTSSLYKALEGFRCRFWRYRNRIYKIQVFSGAAGPPLMADIRFFFKNHTNWMSPAIGVHRSIIKNSGARKGLRSLFRPLWTVLVAKDAARAPLRWLTRVDQWVIPGHFFENLIPCPGLQTCKIPQDWEDYLTLRYGKWQVPTSKWKSWRDDGGYQAAHRIRS